MEGPQQVCTCKFSRSISRGGDGAILTTRCPTSSARGRSGDFQKLIEFYTNPDSTGDNAQLPDSTCVHCRYVKRIVQSDECNHHATETSRMKRMEKTGQH